MDSEDVKSFDPLRFIIYSLDPLSGKNVVEAAVGCGRLDILKLLHEHDRDMVGKRALFLAIKNGYRDIVQWIREHHPMLCSVYLEDSIKVAEWSGHEEMIEILKQ